ncbi:MAG: BamA/TamA family outer membrane protein, partial [Bacteroidota bacterium]
DNFVSSTALNIQGLELDGFAAGNSFRTDEGEEILTGYFNNFSIKQTIARSTVSDPIFPTSGSSFTFSVQLTPPYSAFQKDFEVADDPAERFRWLEYHKWRFNAEWYTQLFDKFVLKADMRFGVVGAYNGAIGVSPFERFQLGGDGLNNQQFGFAGVDIFSIRGYEINEIGNNIADDGVTTATPIFDKLTLELRYPISTNPNSTIYLHTFVQGGNTWRSLRDFNPFDVQRAAGAGLRVFLPMFGVLGFDWGVGFDKSIENPNPSIGDLSTFNIILGFEPE